MSVGQKSTKKSQVKEYHTEFYNLCYQQYVHEFERTDKLHEKTGMWITSMIAIGAASYALGRVDLIDHVRTDVFVFLFYCATLLVWLSLGAGVYFVYQTLRLRSTMRIATMDQWHNWLEQVDNPDNPPSEEKEVDIKDTLIKSLIRDISTCQLSCFRENEKRTAWFKKLQYAVFFSVLFTAIQAIFSVLVSVVR